MPRKAFLKHLIGRLSEMSGFIASALFAIQAGWISVAVVFRYILKNPIACTEELTRFLLVWGVMLGMALTLKEGRHIRVTTFFDKFSPKTQVFIDFIIDILAIIVLVVFVTQGYKLAYFSKNIGEISQGGLEYPIWWSQIALAIGGGLFILQYFIKSFEDLFKIIKKDYRSIPVKEH